MTEGLQRTTPVTLDDATLGELTAFAETLADASGEVIRRYFRARLDVHDKGGASHFDPVTEADRQAEAVIRERIQAAYPNHGILGEEHGFMPGTSGLTWVLDPIDGTRAFITGMPLWGTLIALYDGERPQLGVMDQPYTGERFIGSRQGALLRTAGGMSQLCTRHCPNLSSAVLQTTHTDMFDTVELAAWGEVNDRVRLTRFSGDCYAYCMLAYGLIDLVIESGLAPYDVQALIPIVEAAGGVVSNWSGGSAALGGQVVACGDPRLHEQVLEILAPGAL